MLTRRSFLTGLSCSVFVTAAQARTAPLYFSADGAALTGYDAVSYFQLGRPQIGREDISLRWKEATWRFASVENRDRFERNPRAFAPAFGGYCAYAMVTGQLSATDPLAWQIVEGSLYLTSSLEIEKVWRQNTKVNIIRAERYWPKVLYG
ncbi:MULTISPECIES: YHS domain-containing (seleno)protein [unclassified Ruegeria]|uniref:YHS domain-containing (seleno)protein n=1 Tax=unclassified Ruegeria TaxID=2625375 RepID=UPI0014892E6F|nr:MULTISPECIES: YHS domain-containing (seleno)protein [unclassified Ruegeria]